MAARIITCGFMLFWMSGCVPGGGGGGSSSCTPGDVDDCPCPDGSSSERVCGEDERFGACACAPEGDGMVDDDATVGGDASVDGDAAVATDAVPEPDGPCVADCTGRVCGSDGCGGSCGMCGDDDVCVEGQCEPAPDLCGNGACDPGEDCSSCAADCACPEGQNCVLGACEEPVEGAPVFLTLNTNVRRLTEGESVTFSAVVTDPDGIDDLIGGVLEDPNGQSYGAFVSSGQEGAYSMTISWGEIHRIDPIEFDEARDRTFVAVFFDQGGLRTRQEIAVELHCDGIAACDGTCIDLSDDEANCGACGTTCDDDATCGDGACTCNAGFFGCGNDRCVPERDVCDRSDDCGDGSDEAGCCFADDDCPLGRVCNRDNRCEDGCTGNDRCPADEQCRDGDCVPGCQRDNDCFENEYCGADNRCAVGCRDDDSCPDGRICEDRSCVAGCRNDAGCNAGRICEDQTCVIGCRADAACGAGRICVADNCRVGCRDDDACGGGEICEDLRCEDGCRADAECALDRICRDLRCVPGCQVDAVCPDGQICSEGTCRVGCNDERPCPADQICIDGGCQPACGIDADCGENEYCDGICQPHVCGDDRVGPNEECDGDPRPAGCSDRCEIEGDFERLVEGDEPYLIELEQAGRFEILFRIDVQNDTDDFTIRTGAGVLTLETRSWTGEGCVGDTVMNFQNADGRAAVDDDGGEGLCSRLSVDDGDEEMVVGPGDHTASVRSFSRGPIGFNLLIVEFTPVGLGGACDPFGPQVCPAGSYCADDTQTCTAHACGDGVLEEGEEECDDGNDALGDGCERCAIAPIPLDGPCEPEGQFRCADGLACDPDTLTCVVPECGDGFVAGDEQCEDGNDVAADGCTACRFDPFNGAAEPDGLGTPYVLPVEDGSGRVIFELVDVDTDYFRIDLDVPRDLEVRVVNYPAGDCADDVTIALYAANGELVAEQAVDRGDCTALDTVLGRGIDVGALTPGQYTISAEFSFLRRPGPMWLEVDLPLPAACADGEDNDGDGLVDAADPGCADRSDDDEADPAALPQCSDGEDNDGDMLVDYPEDPDCLFAGSDDEACGGFDNLVIVPPEGGQFEVVTAGRPNLIGASCASGARGGEVPLLVVLDGRATVTVETTVASYDTSLYLRDACSPDGNELACDDDGGDGTLSRLSEVLEAGAYYFFVDGFSTNSGTATVEVTIQPAAE